MIDSLTPAMRAIGVSGNGCPLIAIQNTRLDPRLSGRRAEVDSDDALAASIGDLAPSQLA